MSNHLYRRVRKAAATSIASAAVLAIGLVGTAPTGALAAGPPTTVLSTDVLPGLSSLTSTPTDPATPVEVGITMTNPNAAAQNAAYHAIYTPGSPPYHQFLSADAVRPSSVSRRRHTTACWRGRRAMV